ncbi:hypothetical protein CVD28_07465 [Bacillus sp. M6-12]|uniref:nitrilase-related carbon-nitrogen hydrolase n=1 Tax=Bacillus sp. M6-12 TaxID=2054166 RepID=UPI000C773149|nr:nitrilase-related carbon-nitrogen hydrolase [Bacillus sp. M6-12]PLS18127.1 hypothetical protein CVD28_07465 [Bacillus sp. M6-12]
MRRVILSLVQFESKLMDISANIEKALAFIKDASQQQADLIVFPELFTTGYNLDLIGNKYFDLAEDINGPVIRTLLQAAKQFNINIVAPIAFKTPVPGIIYNSALVISRQGEFVGKYDKTHLWAKENVFFREGMELPVFNLDFGTLGLMICYDGGFPEVSRSLALQGAEIILCPSAFPIQDKDLWEIYFQSRSLENACFVGGINRVGHESELHMFGNNRLYNPRGKELVIGNVDKEEMQVIEIDLEDVVEYRKQIPYLKDLKPDLYVKHYPK